MGIPQAVIDAEAEADRLIEEMAKANAKPPEEEEEAVHATPEEAAEETVPTEPEVAAETEEVETEVVATETEPAVGSSDLESKLGELQAKFDKLQAAHNTLRGKTYAEVPRVMSENKTLRDQITELQKKLSAGVNAPVPAVAGKTSEILASLKEDVNEDVADRIQQLIDATVSDRVAASLEPLAGTVETIQKSSQELAEERYLKDLADKVPDWREIAADPEYSDFLGQVDEMSGSSLYDLATGALNSLDADRMAVFFNKFKKSKGISTPAPAGTKSAAPKASGKAALIEPKGAAKTGVRDVGGEKPDYISTKQMEQFNKERRNMSSEAEAKMEARIDKAIQNGWIVS